MLRSVGLRYIIVFLLAVLMTVPMLFVGGVVNDRKRLAERTERDLGKEWGGQQVVAGPVLMVPVKGTELIAHGEPEVARNYGTKTDTSGRNAPVPTVWKEVTTDAAPLFLLPDQLSLTGAMQTQTRYRGIYQVPVYQADLDMTFDFSLDRIDRLVGEGEEILWDQARVIVTVASNTALRGETELLVDGQDMLIDPLTALSRNGIEAQVGDPRGLQNFQLSMNLNGAKWFLASPAGRQTTFDLTADWPHPSFKGNYLPDDYDVTDEGFDATWSIPHLARALPQAGREDPFAKLSGDLAFGVDIFEPNNFYKKAYRASNYAILFIALTFLTILLLDRDTNRPTHPVQYILVGLSQATFVLLMVAYAEQFGFLYAYLLAAGATIFLLTAFGIIALRLGRRGWVMGATLVVIYAALYFILVSVDFALLAGATLAFLAIAAAMFGTRNEDWYAHSKGGVDHALKDPAPEVEKKVETGDTPAANAEN